MASKGNYMRIVDWDVHYENNRTRDLKKMGWVPMPNRHDGDGYTQLILHPNGPAHFGAWCALVEVASRCEPRGSLLRDSDRAHDTESLSRMTRIPVSVWEEAIPRMVECGWIIFEPIPQEGAGRGGYHPADHPQEGAVGGGGRPAGGCVEGKKEGKERREGKEGAAPPSTPSFLEAMKTVNPNATLSPADNARLETVAQQYGIEPILTAYRAHQKAKPGKAVRFFLEDLHQYLPKKAAPAQPPGPTCPKCGARATASAEPDVFTCSPCHLWLRRNGDGKLRAVAPPAPVDTKAARKAAGLPEAMEEEPQPAAAESETTEDIIF